MVKIKSTYGFTPECRELLLLLARKFGVSQTAVIELAVRKMAQAEKVHAQSAQDTPKPNA